MNIPTPESEEKDQGVNLSYHPPERDHHQMIIFEARTDKEANAYNFATRIHLNNHPKKLGMCFHQKGAHSGAGGHIWEIWDDHISEEELKALLPKIEKVAQMYLDDDMEAINNYCRELLGE
jgi:hypothetical protein